MNKVMRNASAGFVAFSSVLLLVGVGSSATAATDHEFEKEKSAIDQIIPAVKDSSEIQNNVLVEGEIEFPDDDALAGVPVFLKIWPSGEELEKLTTGDPVNVRTIAKAITDEDGKFTLASETTEILGAYMDEEDIINFELVVPLENDQMQKTFSRRIDLDGNNVVNTEALDVGFNESSIAETTEFTEGQSDIFKQDIEGDLVLQPETQPLTASEVLESSLEGDVFTEKICPTYYRGEHSRATTRVAQVWSNTSKSSVQFDYSNGGTTETTMGVAVRKGTKGAASAQGTATNNFKSTTIYDPIVGKKNIGFNKKTRYGLTEEKCSYLNNSAVIKQTFRPIGMTDSSIVTLPANKRPKTKPVNCGKYYNGKLTIDSGKATKFTNGIDANSISVGLKLQYSMGYSTSTHFSIKSTDSKSLKICGTAGHPEPTKKTLNVGDIVLSR